MGAETQTGISEMIRFLDADSYWTNRPITVRFTERIEMYPAAQGGPDVTNRNVYSGQGVLTKDGFKALALLDISRRTGIDDTAPLRKFFVKSNDYVMSYFLYSTNSVKKGTNGVTRTVNVGEATIGVPSCNCTEKFWSFPMTPSVVARKLEGLKDVTCSVTNFHGESFVLVVGRSEDEKTGMWWHIFFKKTDATWLPVRTEVFFHNQLLSTIEAFFNPGAEYSPNRIQLTLFRAKEVAGLFIWSDIKATPGDESGDRLSGMEPIPDGLIVTDYRFKKPAIYMMADNEKTADPHRTIIRMDVPPADRKNAPENLVQILFVRLFLFALLFSPVGWVAINKMRTR